MPEHGTMARHMKRREKLMVKLEAHVAAVVSLGGQATVRQVALLMDESDQTARECLACALRAEMLAGGKRSRGQGTQYVYTSAPVAAPPETTEGPNG